MVVLNTILLILLLLIVINFAFEQVLGLLNYKSGRGEVPSILSDVYDSDRYAKYLRYKQVSFKFGTLVSLLSVGVTLFLVLKGFVLLDDYVSQMADNQIVRGLMFFGILGFFADLISTPFSLYSTFVIEQQYGFNKTTPKTFLFDKVKTYAIAIIIGGGLLSLLIWVYQLSGNNFWWMAWILISGFSIFMAMFYSSLIVPIFNKQKPLEPGELRDRLNALALKTGFILKDIFIIDGSKRSTRANAYFAGLGKKRRIVLYDNLLKDQTIDQIEAVLAHEIGHYKLKHIQKSMVWGILQTGIMLFVFSLIVNGPYIYHALGASNQNFHLGLVVFIILYSPVSMLLSIGMNALSRKFEFQADAFSSRFVDGENLISSLKNLASANMSSLTPNALYVWVYYSHPPLLERIMHLKKQKNI
ncbi:MAG: M48 family metallopeptidase [Lentimicrobium sp.]|jgi:STE24 endopeptidase|nr:M48 family metallopeptidase [Lentimicrobium sp.]